MSFIHKDFLLSTEYAKRLYHDYAKDLPIIDYHNHLIPEQIAKNKKFENITQIWLYGDHYKWRAMRTLGIEEKYITGNASDWEKFEKWAEAVPYTLRNPLYHWSHLELKRYFGVDSLLASKNAKEIFDQTATLLQQDDFAVQSLLGKMKVEVVCTTDDPTDDLAFHQQFAKGSATPFKMLPTFRPDKALDISGSEAYQSYLKKLSKVSGIDISNYATFLEALQQRHDFFAEVGGKLSDHGLNTIDFAEATENEVKSIFEKAWAGKAITPIEKSKFRTAALIEVCKMNHAKGWTQQFHLGALRNNNTRMLSELGPDTGYDSIGDFSHAQGLSKLFNHLENEKALAKTIIYNLNPSDNEVFATMIGNFMAEGTKGKMQFGSGWWFLDQLDGMEKQMNTLSNMGLISCFVGMLTDSRSFLSFPRHEYFRRLVCNLFGNDMASGKLPNDMEWIGKIVQDISYYNAKQYFNF